MKLLGSIILTCALFSAPSLAATVFHFETRDIAPSNPAVQKMQIIADGSYLKMELEVSANGQADSTMIFDDREGKMTVVDHPRREYMVMDQETISGFSSQISNAMSGMQKQMEAAMANMPPEQQEMMKKMMKDRMPSIVEEAPKVTTQLRKTSRRESVGDYNCVIWEITRDGEKIREHCVSSWEEVGLSSETIDLLKHLGEYFEQTLGALTRSVPGGNALDIENPFGTLKEMDAFPVLTREFEDGEATSERVLRSVTRESMAPAAFGPPEGYSKRELQMPQMPG